jgi:hypothetical protein
MTVQLGSYRTWFLGVSLVDVPPKSTTQLKIQKEVCVATALRIWTQDIIYYILLTGLRKLGLMDTILRFTSICTPPFHLDFSAPASSQF